MSGLAVLPYSDQQRWHGLYKLAPLIIILLYMRTRGDRAVTQVEIADNLGIARNTAGKALRQLVILGALTKYSHNDGYLLTDGGRQMLLGLDDPGCAKVEHPSLKESFKLNLKDSNDKKERRKEMLKNCASSDEILANSKILFPGHEVINFGLADNLQSDYVLAWLAQAYDQHKQGKISHPWALVYRRLQTGRILPDKKYQDDPFAHLPNNFLAALGLEAPEIVDAEADVDIEVDETVRITEVRVTVEAEVYDAWMDIQDQLRREMERAAFETWVQETYPASYDGELFRVEARNRYAADWLTTRLAARVQALLTRRLNNPNVQVRFGVATETED